MNLEGKISKTKELSAAFAGTALGIIMILLSNAIRLSAVLLHLFTAYILWQVHGIIVGIIGLFFPFVAEAYTFIACWVAAGFLNYYTLAIVVVIALYSLPYLIFLVVATLHKD